MICSVVMVGSGPSSSISSAARSCHSGSKPIICAMFASRRLSGWLHRLSAQPASSPRPVRPMRWTWISGRGDIDVDHRLEPLDVEAAGGHVGGHQHRAAAVGELDQHLVALALVELAVEGECRDAMAVQHVDEVAALLAGVAESQGTRRPVVLEQVATASRRPGARSRRSADGSCSRRAARAASPPAAGAGTRPPAGRCLRGRWRRTAGSGARPGSAARHRRCRRESPCRACGRPRRAPAY